MRVLRLVIPSIILAFSFLWHPLALADATFRMPLSEDNARRAVTLFLNSRESVEFTPSAQTQTYQFSPPESGQYAFVTFPGIEEDSPALHARLYAQNAQEPIAAHEGETIRIEGKLEKDVVYTLVLSGDAGRADVEVMRLAHGRSIDSPISLLGETERYAKVITSPRDTHWYAFTAPRDGLYTVRTENARETPLDTRGYLLNARGTTIAYNDDLRFPSDTNFLIRAELKAGERYFLRVSAFSNTTGMYRLVLVAPEENQPMPEGLTVTENDLTLFFGEEHQLYAVLTPTGAYPDVAWSSSDHTVASVSPDGLIKALSPGEAVISVVGANGVKAECVIRVLPVPVTQIQFPKGELSIAVGETASVELRLTPSNATHRSVAYAVSNPEILTVDEDGTITALSPGEATVTASSKDGEASASLPVTVTPPAAKYRALVLGEQLYVDGRTRVGAVNTAQGIADMLKHQAMGAGAYEVVMRLDSTRAQVIEGIQTAFAGAKEGDVSLFYINSHGDYENGMAYVELHDGSRLTAVQLERLLREIPGTVVVIVDCCRSGGFVGKSTVADRFETGVVNAFSKSSATIGTAFTDGKYKLLVSSSMDQDSYRISSEGDFTEASMATVFARSLSEGAGWDLIRDRTVSLKADFNKDRAVTFQEIYLYAQKRVMYYLSETGVRQSVQVYPEGDALVLFKRRPLGE